MRGSLNCRECPSPTGRREIKSPWGVVRPSFILRHRLIPYDTPEPALRQRSTTESSGVSLDARLRRPFRHPFNPRRRTMTVYGYARVSRGRDDGTDTLQNQRMRLAGADVDADHIYQDIITGTVMQRPGLGDLLDTIQPGDALVVTALERLGRDTPGLFIWSGRGSAGVGHAGPCPGGGGDQPTGAGGGMGATEGNTSGQCLIVSQAQIRTVRSYRGVLSLPTPG